jgi:hypothetical protein
MPNSLQKFKATYERIVKVLELAVVLRHIQISQLELSDLEPKEKQSLIDLDVPDLYRSSIVFAVAAMDSYFTDKFIEILVPYLKKRGANKHLTELLLSAGLNTKEALNLLRYRRPYRRIRSLVGGHLEKYVTQSVARIDELYNCIGLKHLSKNASHLARKKRLISTIKSAVNRRNQIVHQADLLKYGKLNDIDFKTTARYLKGILLFVDKCDVVIDNLTM